MDCLKMSWATYINLSLSMMLFLTLPAKNVQASTSPYPLTECQISQTPLGDSTKACTNLAPSSAPSTNRAINSVSASLNLPDLNACAAARGCADAVRSDPGLASAAIDVHGTCRYVDNASSATSYFVPLHSSGEWTDFLTNAPLTSSINLVKCSRPYGALTVALSAPPYGGCTSSSAVATPQLYARWTPSSFAPWTSVPDVTFTGCYGNYTSIKGRATWQGLDADIHPSDSWQQVPKYGPNLTMSASAKNAANVTITGQTITVLGGNPIALSWGPATFPVTSTGGPSAWLATPASSPSSTVVTAPPASATYAVTSTDPTTGLSSTASVFINIEAPISVTLTASRSSIDLGSPTTLSWSVGNDNPSLTCWTNGWAANFSPSASGGAGSVTVTPTVTPTQTYTITCGDTLQSQTARADVNVCPSGSTYSSGTNSCVTNGACGTGANNVQYGCDSGTASSAVDNSGTSNWFCKNGISTSPQCSICDIGYTSTSGVCQPTPCNYDGNAGDYISLIAWDPSLCSFQPPQSISSGTSFPICADSCGDQDGLTCANGSFTAWHIDGSCSPPAAASGGGGPSLGGV
jgi:hypothetical protein